MTPDELIGAFSGEAKRVEPELKLADGNVVAAAIERFDVGPDAFRVGFVFGDGRLVLVSLRTPKDRYAGVDVFLRMKEHLEVELGAPVESTGDDNFIDLRQVRWKSGRTTVDLEYIPGVVVVVYYPSGGTAAPPR